MRRIGMFLVVLSLLLLALPVLAQEEGGNIVRVFVDKAKTGMEQQYEEAVKQHIAWHREQGDTWNWVVRRIESGRTSGSTCGSPAAIAGRTLTTRLCRRMKTQPTLTPARGSTWSQARACSPATWPTSAGRWRGIRPLR